MKSRKKYDRHCVNVCIQQCEDNEGRFLFVSVKTDNATTNKNAVWVKDYKSAIEFAQKFFEQETDIMDVEEQNVKEKRK